ncbi:MAG: starvation-inducible DNA-binding protein [Oceanicoccus sp.]
MTLKLLISFKLKIMNSKTIEGLGQVLASTYTLYLKTQNFHWNVTGPFFQTLHLMFEGQYSELALANDLIAERIRSLGAFAPGTYKEFSELSFVKEEEGHFPAEDMVAKLLADHEVIIAFSKKMIEVAAELKDEGTVDVLTTRLSEHEKTAWMLRSFLN